MQNTVSVSWLGPKVQCYNPGLQKGNYTFYKSFKINDEVFSLGDFALINKTENGNPKCDKIVRFLCFYESHQKWHAGNKYRATVRWYEWARNLPKKANPLDVDFDINNEVIEDLRTLDIFISLNHVKRKCKVIFGTEEDPVHLIYENKLDKNVYFSCRYRIMRSNIEPIFSNSVPASEPKYLDYDFSFSLDERFSPDRKRKSTNQTGVNSDGFNITYSTPEMKNCKPAVPHNNEIVSDEMHSTPIRRSNVVCNLNKSFEQCKSPDNTAPVLNYSIVDQTMDDNNLIRIKLRLAEKYPKVVLVPLKNEMLKSAVTQTTNVLKNLKLSGSKTASKKTIANGTSSEGYESDSSEVEIESQNSEGKEITNIKGDGVSPLKRNRITKENVESTPIKKTKSVYSKEEVDSSSSRNSKPPMFKVSPVELKHSRKLRDIKNSTLKVKEREQNTVDNERDKTGFFDNRELNSSSFKSFTRTKENDKVHNKSMINKIESPNSNTPKDRLFRVSPIRTTKKTRNSIKNKSVAIKRNKEIGTSSEDLSTSPSKRVKSKNSEKSSSETDNSIPTLEKELKCEDSDERLYFKLSDIKRVSALKMKKTLKISNTITIPSDFLSSEEENESDSLEEITVQEDKTKSKTPENTPTRNNVRCLQTRRQSYKEPDELHLSGKNAKDTAHKLSSKIKIPESDNLSSEEIHMIRRSTRTKKKNYKNFLNPETLDEETRRYTPEHKKNATVKGSSCSTLSSRFENLNLLAPRKSILKSTPGNSTPKKIVSYTDLPQTATPGTKNASKTPRQNKSTRDKQGVLTPSMQSRTKSVKASKDLLFKARSQLHVSYIPQHLPCREKEYSDVFSFLQGKLRDGIGGCMYISGVPGTGKTATVTEVIRHLQESSQKRNLPSFRYVNINGMSLSEPRQAYVEIIKQLDGRTVRWEQAQTILENKFAKGNKKSEPVILIVDELDILCTKRQDVVYNLLDWPTKSHAQLIVITIANTMDLPERLLMGRVTSRLGLTRLTFQPYSFKQLQEIIVKRLLGTNVFNPDAIQLVARKVASVSGDARRALDICRRAAEIAEKESKDTLVDMKHVSDALNAMITQPKIQAILHCSQLEKLILQSVAAEVERTGVEETNLENVYMMFKSLATIDGFRVVSITVALAAITRLGCSRLLLVDQKSNSANKKIILNVSSDDIYYALNKTKL